MLLSSSSVVIKPALQVCALSLRAQCSSMNRIALRCTFCRTREHYWGFSKRPQIAYLLLLLCAYGLCIMCARIVSRCVHKGRGNHAARQGDVPVAGLVDLCACLWRLCMRTLSVLDCCARCWFDLLYHDWSYANPALLPLHSSHTPSGVSRSPLVYPCHVLLSCVSCGF